MIKCPSIVAKQSTEPNIPQCYIKPETTKTKCICHKLDITSSSSTSGSSERFPVKLKSKCNTMDRKMPVAKRRNQSSVENPILAAPPIIKCTKMQTTIGKPFNPPSAKSDQYYSCSSDDTDEDTTDKSYGKLHQLPKRSKADKNSVILELLHEVVHLINNDNPIRKEALRITKVEPSSLDEKSSNIATQTSKVKVEHREQDLTLPPIYQYPPLMWPPPCLCYAYGMASVQDKNFNLPPLQPYNLTCPNVEGLQVPQPFVYEESDSFKDCSSGSKRLSADDKMANNLLCICSKTSNICPRHGQLKKKLKEACFPCSCSEKIKTKGDTEIPPIKGEEYIDEELHPCYVDESTFTSYNPNEPCLDCLLEFDDEDPKQTVDTTEVDEEGQPIYSVPMAFDELYEPCQDCLMEYDDEEPYWPYEDDKPMEEMKEHSSELTFDPNQYNEPCLDCLSEYDDEEPSRPDIKEIVLEIKERSSERSSELTFDPNQYYEPCVDCLSQYDDEEPSRPDIKEIMPEIMETDNVQDLPTLEDPVETLYVPPEEIEKKIEDFPDEILEESEKSPYIVETSPSTGRNVYNFLPDIDRSPSLGDPKQIIPYKESEEEEELYSNYNEEETEFVEDEYELAKEIRAEKLKKKQASEMDDGPIERMALATIKQLEEGEGSREEMKFFIDSLILDLDAMEHARRKSQFEKNISKSKSGVCARESFPVTIAEVTDLGANSLYVKWIIHDCYGIGGYEIYTDGYLTNRYYNSKHDAAVITHVDITVPHKIALVAQPCADDETISLICNKSKNQPKSLMWKTDEDKERKSYSALWIPSIYLYDPVTCRAAVTAPNTRDKF